MTRKTLEDRTRLNLALSGDIKDKIGALQNQIGADSMTEVVRRAVEAFQILIVVRDNGGKVFVQSTPRGKRETLFLM